LLKPVDLTPESSINRLRVSIKKRINITKPKAVTLMKGSDELRKSQVGFPEGVIKNTERMSVINFSEEYNLLPQVQSRYHMAQS